MTTPPAALLAAAAVGCLAMPSAAQPTRPDAATPPTTVPADAAAPQRVQWHGWDAYRIANDAVEVIVVPSIARVMHYGPAGGGDEANVLWTNPQVAGQAPGEAEGWQNFGGDKTWPWPQADWPDLFAAAWPPPPPFEGVAWTGELDGNAVRLVGPPQPIYGIRPVRTVALDATGSGLTVTTSYEPLNNAQPTTRPDGDAAVPSRVGAWHVTQIPRDGTTVVAVVAGEEELPPKDMTENGGGDGPPTFVEKLGDGRYAVTRPGDESVKAGLDAEVLAAGLTVGGRPMIYVQRLAAATGTAYIEANDLAQVYISGDTGDLPAWTELEFTAPVSAGESQLVMRWLLEPVDAASVDDPAALADAAARVAEADAE